MEDKDEVPDYFEELGIEVRVSLKDMRNVDTGLPVCDELAIEDTR